jgi:integrase
VSATPSLALVESPRPDSWQAALEAALRAEFLVSPLILPAGSPLAPPECGVQGCPRSGETAPWGRFDTRLCGAHHQKWVKDGKPACDDWLAGQLPPRILRPIEGCSVAACARSVECAGLCGAHRSQWVQAGRPALDRFALSARPVASEEAGCRVAGCEFPCVPGGRAGLCDAHSKRFHTWRGNRAHLAEAERSIERYIAYLDVCGTHATLACLALPSAPVVALELRFVLQCRHDEGGGFIHCFRWGETVRRLNELGVRSLLDDDWHLRPGTSDATRVPAWMFYVNYARKVLLAFRGRWGLDDPWARDVWHIPGLPVDDQAMGRLRNLDWRPIRPVWLRELSKRWARHRLRAGTSTSHVNGVRLAVVRLIEFCELQGWPLDDPGCLTRELFDAFLDHVRFLEASAKQKHRVAYGVKQLLEDAHDLGWISLRHPRVYLRGELPTQRQWLPRALPAEVMVRLNDPRSLEPLMVSERAAVLVLMDCGLRATDTACLKLDAVISGSDGAPYLRYWNHKRRREAIVPISERAAQAIAAQRAWVRERYPADCEWLFPRFQANGLGRQPMGYSFIFATLRRWAEVLDLRDEHGEPVRPSPHAFRHTYATGLVNNDVDLFSVQSLLDHDSPEMTWRYARLSNETLRRKWEQGQQRINIRGELVPLDLDGELSDAAWAKEQIARAKQTLPNGYCGLPLQQTCPHPNACLTCPAFLTDQTFLPQHREQLARTEQLIEHGKQNGNQRLVEINEATRVNLVAIIERAEQLEREGHDHQQREEEGDGAA